MAINLLTAGLKVSLNWSANKTATGLEPIKSDQTALRTFSYTNASSKPPTSAGGADEFIGQVRYISTGGTDTIDLSAALTNVVNESSVTVARVKAFMFQLLGNGEVFGPSDYQATGTLCTGIQIGGEGTHPAKLFFGTTASKIDVISEGVGGAMGIGTGGYAGVRISSGMNDKLLVANLDSTYTAVYFFGMVAGAS